MGGVSGAGNGAIQAGWDQVQGVQKMSAQGIEQANLTAKYSSELEASKNINKMAKNAVTNAGTLV